MAAPDITSCGGAGQLRGARKVNGREDPATTSLFGETARSRSARRRLVGGGLGVKIAGLVHRLQLLAAQEDHALGQAAARRNPLPDRRRIHRIAQWGGCGVGGGGGGRRLAPHSQAACKPRLACEVTQIRSCGTAPSTMVQAEALRPSMITVS